MRLLVNVNGKEQLYEADSSKTLLENFQMFGITELETPCGGKGTCKKCTVTVMTAQGSKEVLACQTPAEGIIHVSLGQENASLIAEEGDCYLYPADFYELEQETDAIEIEDSDFDEEGYDLEQLLLSLAVDIGTTTVVCHLLNAKNGKRLATVSRPNAQKVFGADVIARIQASVDGKLSEMKKAITDQIDEMILEACEKFLEKEIFGMLYAPQEVAGKIERIAIAGNTTMEHIFCNLAPDSIGVAPFTPQSLFGESKKASELALKSVSERAEVYLLPAIAGYVGGDITADILATQMHKAKGPVLMLDIGTNGEMALGDENGIVSCATAAGPAFEGAEITMGMPAMSGAINKVWVEEANGEGAILYATIGNQPAIGICGSGLIDLLACLLELEIIDETGSFADEDELPTPLAMHLDEDEDGVCYYLDKAKTVKITQADIRKLQLAKAAIAAGIQVLLQEMHLQEEDVESLLLAGGFGSYLDPKSAARIGLISESLLPVTKAVGNAAGEGAVSAVLSKKAREELGVIQQTVRYEELSTNKSFNDFYMDAMYFEE